MQIELTTLSTSSYQIKGSDTHEHKKANLSATSHLAAGKLDFLQDGRGGLLRVSCLHLLASVLHRQELNTNEAQAHGAEDATQVEDGVHLVLLEHEKPDSNPREHDEGLVGRNDHQLVVELDRTV